MSSPLVWPPKDPDEVLDYEIDWTARLSSDTISNSPLSSIWILPDGLIKDDDLQTDSTTTIWLSGGTLGSSYVLTNRIKTVGGRTMDQSVKLQIKSK